MMQPPVPAELQATPATSAVLPPTPVELQAPSSSPGAPSPMRSKLARAAFWSITGNSGQYIVTFLLLVYLAHVLQPRDFGLMATVSIGLDLGTRIARWGQVELLQQMRHRNAQSYDQSFRLSLAIAAGFALLFIVIARPVGRVYHSDQLALMVYLCAPVFLWSAASSTPEAILRTEFRFGVLAFRNTMATLAGAAVAIVLARQGYGPLALALQRVVQSVVSGVWVWTAIAWRPSLQRSVGWSPTLLRDGGHVMGGTMMPLIVPRSVDLFVSFALGPVQLGLMRIAFRINDFVAQLVVVPLVGVASAQLNHVSGNMAATRRSYLRLTQASAALVCPVLIGMTLVAPEAVPIIFGERWRACVPIVQVIGLLGLAAPINYYFASVMVALGQSRLVFRQGVFQVVLGVVLSAAAAQVSLVALAVAHVVRGGLVSIYNIYDLRRHMQLGLRELCRSMAPPYLGTLAMSIVVIALRFPLTGAVSPFVMLTTLGVAGALAYLAAIWLGGVAGFWPRYANLAHVRLRARFTG